MTKQRYPSGTWVWYKKQGRWRRGIVAKQDGFDPQTNTYSIHEEGVLRKRPNRISLNDIQAYAVGRYLDGKYIKYRHPKSGEWVEGIAYHPTSPSCTEYLVAPRNDLARGRTTIVKKKDIRLD